MLGIIILIVPAFGALIKGGKSYLQHYYWDLKD